MPAEDALQLRHRIVAASGASVASALVVNPLDIVKTRIQAQISSELRGAQAAQPAAADSLIGRLALDGCSPGCARPDQGVITSLCRGPECSAYSSTLDGIRKIVRREGILALWRGTDIALLMAVPTVGVYLPMYDYLNGRFHSLAAYGPLVAGALSRTAAVLVTSPLELLRVRLQASQKHTLPAPHAQQQGRMPRCTGTPQAAESGKLSSRGPAPLWQHMQSGSAWVRFRGAYTGVGAMLARDVPFSAIYWGLLEPIRHALLPRTAVPPPTQTQIMAVNIAAGTMGGAAAAAITTPLDVAKTHAQLAEGGQRHRVLATLRSLAAERGPKALFAGVGARAARTAPSCAIVLTSYEMLKSWAAAAV
ncbi:hypothetical protein WJX73_002840 [Symbiochloris irregularis]|uniref:Mitochondrial carrier protein n=1 Tax=Symbiochloris irregularis TaxID=706552 RepID=A0AAW1Q276_9CHLO